MFTVSLVFVFDVGCGWRLCTLALMLVVGSLGVGVLIWGWFRLFGLCFGLFVLCWVSLWVGLWTAFVFCFSLGWYDLLVGG